MCSIFEVSEWHLCQNQTKSDKNDGKYRRSSDGKAPRPSTDCKNGGLFQEVVLEVARWTKRTKEV